MVRHRPMSTWQNKRLAPCSFPFFFFSGVGARGRPSMAHSTARRFVQRSALPLFAPRKTGILSTLGYIPYPMTDWPDMYAFTILFYQDVIGDNPMYYAYVCMYWASKTSLLGACCDTSPDNPGQARRGIVFAHEAGRDRERRTKQQQQQQHRRFAFRHVQRLSHRTEAACGRVPIKHVPLSRFRNYTDAMEL